SICSRSIFVISSALIFAITAPIPSRAAHAAGSTCRAPNRHKTSSQAARLRRPAARRLPETALLFFCPCAAPARMSIPASLRRSTHAPTSLPLLQFPAARSVPRETPAGFPEAVRYGDDPPGEKQNCAPLNRVSSPLLGPRLLAASPRR